MNLVDKKRIGIMSGVVGLLGFIAQYGPSLILERWLDGAFGGMIPVIGTTGQTMVTYSLLANIAGPLVTLVLAVSLGYYVAQRVDIVREYRQIVGIIAIGSTSGVTLGGAPMLADVSSSAGIAFTTFLLIASLGSMLASVAALVIVGALAGAALAHFQTSDNNPSPPTEVNSDSPTTSSTDSTDDTSQIQSQLTR